MTQAGGASAKHEEAKAIAVHLIEEARKRKASGIDAFLHQYGLATEEGVALMCLAEALLRVPDAATADALIRDKIGDIDWAEHMGESSSTFVNAATFSLMLTGEVLERPEEAQKGMGKTLKRAVNRLGEPVIRRATLQAMRILGGQFVYGRTINESLKRAAPERARGLTHSFDMLGEAAMTFDDAERYRVNYHEAIARLVRESTGDVRTAPGISVKLSALHPKYTFMHADIAIAALPIVRDLRTAARDANIHFTIDAGEADRLELSIGSDRGAGARRQPVHAPRWQPLGASASPSRPIRSAASRWSTGPRVSRANTIASSSSGFKGPIGTESSSPCRRVIDFPVFTRKLATDVSYLACAEKMLAADDAIYPAFATHNAYDRRDQGDGEASRSSSSGCTGWARTSTVRWPRWRATAAPTCASANRHAQGLAGLSGDACSRTAPTASSIAWPMPTCLLPQLAPTRLPTWRR